MTDFDGMRVVVIGLARAGSSLALALTKAGAAVTVVDEKPADSLSMIEQMDRLAGRGVDIATSWSGNVEWHTTDLIVPSPGVPRTHPALNDATKRGVPVWSEIEVAYRLSKAPVVAITGTNGKSTVTALTYHILHQAGKGAILCGNIAGSGFPETPIATAASRALESDILVSEVSSFQLEWIDTFRPHACTITNISEDHLDRYGSFAEYAAMKKRVHSNQTSEDVAVINAFHQETFDDGLRARRLTFGEAGSDVVIDSDRAIMASTGIEIRSEELWAGARHNLENAAAAWLLASSQGADGESVPNAIKSFKGIANRMEILGTWDGRRFINNSMCTNPEALRSSIEGCPAPMVVLAGGVLQAEDLSPLERIDESRLRAAILFGRDGERLAPTFSGKAVPVEVVEDLATAFSVAIAASFPGDTIILSPGCKSFDQFDDFIARGECFRSIVRECIGGSAN
ncbi:MAG: UDP-N-acetylmuramoyl-L-alanine--D-glutamate ligase [Armatimonadetes bacterium]|nr:UDP-N-acetylmuramoyl-L-alanine--D-glutamate ligase [Armatimonadota bacterium]